MQGKALSGLNIATMTPLRAVRRCGAAWARRRLFETPDLSVLAAEDLDGDGRLELFLRQGDGLLRIARYAENRFVDLWQGEDAEPLFQPPPPEQDLARTVGVRSTLANPRVWRKGPAAKPFLMRIEGQVVRCQLEPDGSLRQLGPLTDHPALGPPQPETHVWNGRTLTVLDNGRETSRQTVPDHQVYLAPPPLVGRLDGQLRVVVRDHQGALLSLAPDGTDDRELVRRTPAFANVTHSTEYPQICDVDGDGEPELLTSTMLTEGQPAVVAVDGQGHVKLRIDPPAGISQLSLGPTGSLGPGQGRWIVVRYIEPLSGPSVVAYDGRELWRREHFGSYGDRGTIFALHTPTAVCDYHGDGVDDFLAQSENFYNIVDGRTGEDFIDPMPIHSNAVAGHWTAYATPMLVDLLGDGDAKVFYSRSYSLTVVSDLRGTPFWHDGLMRDTTATSHAGLGDLDGDGRIEIVVSQPDGLLTAYQPEPAAHPCPTCPEDIPNPDHSRADQRRWTFQLPPPVSDITAADLDGDGADELLLGAGDGRLYALKEIGGEVTVLWSLTFDRRVGAPILVDLGSDRSAAILVPTEDGILHCCRLRKPDFKYGY